MLAYTREQIITHLHELPSLINMYQEQDFRFIEKSIQWLVSVENTLIALRNPLASYVAVERGKIIASHSGYQNENISPEHLSKRKIRMATTALVLSEVEESLHQIVIDIEKQFSIWREKMAQFVAVATNNNSGAIPLPPTEPRNEWLKSSWANFAVSPETQGMYNYLNTAMSQSDRLYLLNELIENLINGRKFK